MFVRESVIGVRQSELEYHLSSLLSRLKKYLKISDVCHLNCVDGAYIIIGVRMRSASESGDESLKRKEYEN